MRVCLLISLLIIAMFSVATAVKAEHPAGLQACDCSSIRIYSEFDTVRAGDVVSFEVRSKKGDPSSKHFIWTVSMGQIVSGHGTSRIEVQTYEGIEIKEPRATSTPLPGLDSYILDGFIFSGGLGPRRWPPVQAAVRVIDATCECSIDSLDVSVGWRTQKRNLFADMTDLELSTFHPLTSCQPGQTSDPESEQKSNSKVIDVRAFAFDPDGDVLVYDYAVSAGTIIGKGARVQWDLRGVPPGTYSITAGADDGCGHCGKSITRPVTVLGCE